VGGMMSLITTPHMLSKHEQSSFLSFVPPATLSYFFPSYSHSLLLCPDTHTRCEQRLTWGETSLERVLVHQTAGGEHVQVQVGHGDAGGEMEAKPEERRGVWMSVCGWGGARGLV